MELKKIIGQYRREKYTHHLTKLEYVKPNKVLIEELKVAAFTCYNREHNKKLKEVQRRHWKYKLR